MKKVALLLTLLCACFLIQSCDKRKDCVCTTTTYYYTNGQELTSTNTYNDLTEEGCKSFERDVEKNNYEYHVRCNWGK